MSLTTEDLKKLKLPFDEKTICVKVQSRSKNKDKVSLVLYLQHTDVYARIEEVDPCWASEITGEQHFPAPDSNSEDWFNIRAKVTIKGVSRENTGEGRDKKSATSDAIKRAAMLFGIGRYLYDTEPVWVPYNEQTDYYKTFTITEYMAALRPGQVRPPISGGVSAPPPAQNQGPAPSQGRATARSTMTAKPKIAAVPNPAPAGPEAKLKSSAATEVIMAGKKLGMNLMQLNEHIQEMAGKSLRDMNLDEINYVLVELNRQYEGV